MSKNIGTLGLALFPESRQMKATYTIEYYEAWRAVIPFHKATLPGLDIKQAALCLPYQEERK